MKVIPLGDKVVVQRVEAETTSSGGIVLPDSAQINRPAGEFSAWAMARFCPMAGGACFKSKKATA